MSIAVYPQVQCLQLKAISLQFFFGQNGDRHVGLRPRAYMMPFALCVHLTIYCARTHAQGAKEFVPSNTSLPSQEITRALAPNPWLPTDSDHGGGDQSALRPAVHRDRQVPGP